MANASLQYIQLYWGRKICHTLVTHKQVYVRFILIPLNEYHCGNGYAWFHFMDLFWSCQERNNESVVSSCFVHKFKCKMLTYQILLFCQSNSSLTNDSEFVSIHDFCWAWLTLFQFILFDFDWEKCAHRNAQCPLCRMIWTHSTISKDQTRSYGFHFDKENERTFSCTTCEPLLMSIIRIWNRFDFDWHFNV